MTSLWCIEATSRSEIRDSAIGWVAADTRESAEKIASAEGAIIASPVAQDWQGPTGQVIWSFPISSQ